MSRARREVVVVGAQQVVGWALCEAWRARGVEVREVVDLSSAMQQRGEEVGILYVDTSAWWDGGGEVSEQALADYQAWLWWAKRHGVGRVGVVTSAATLGVGCEESGLYVPGEGRAWEDVVWRMEARAYEVMGQGVGVWLALPTMAVGEHGQMKSVRQWRESGQGGDLVSAQDVARGCVAMLERGRMGRRYVMSGEWVEGEREGASGSYLGGRRYEGMEWARGELGYGRRWDGEALEAMIG